MKARNALSEVLVALSNFPVVALLGPRQVGKTTLALAVADSLGEDSVRYLDLESEADLAKLADAEAYLEAQRGRLVILDEIHHRPDLFRLLRGVVDRRRRDGLRTGQFLVLGSASLDLLRQSSESLAGRISFVDLAPFTTDEIGATTAELNALWLRGGFPDSLYAPSDAASFTWRKMFIRTYLERDVPEFAPRVPAETLRRFWTMLAHNQGQQLNAARLAAGLGVSSQTVSRYVDLLVDLLLVRRLPGWSGNVGKRLVKTPKVYVRDSGVVHALLGLPLLEDVLGHPVAGFTWEGMVIESVLAAAKGATVSYYRTSAGAEVDLVIEGRGSRRYVIEIKRSTAPVVSKGFWIGREDLSAAGGLVIYPGLERIPFGNGTEARGVRDAMEWVRERVQS